MVAAWVVQHVAFNAAITWLVSAVTILASEILTSIVFRATGGVYLLSATSLQLMALALMSWCSSRLRATAPAETFASHSRWAGMHALFKPRRLISMLGHVAGAILFAVAVLAVFLGSSVLEHTDTIVLTMGMCAYIAATYSHQQQQLLVDETLPAIRRPLHFRIKQIGVHLIALSTREVWRLFKAVLPLAWIVSYLRGTSLDSTGVLSSIGLHALVFAACFAATFALHFVQRVFDEAFLHVSAKTASMDEIVAALAEPSTALLSLVRMQHEAIPTKSRDDVVRASLGIVREFTTDVDADAPITIALEQDYSTRPFDDPGLIGKGVPIEIGWATNPTTKNAESLPLLASSPRAAKNSPSRVLKSPGKIPHLRMRFQFSESWLQPSTPAARALTLLQDQPDGTFIVHAHQADSSRLCVTVVHSTQSGSAVLTATNMHTMDVLISPQRFFKLSDATKEFSSVEELVRYYATHPYRVDKTGHPRKLRSIDQHTNGLLVHLQRYTTTLRMAALNWLKTVPIVRYFTDERPSVKLCHAYSHSTRCILALRLLAKAVVKQSHGQLQQAMFQQLPEVVGTVIACLVAVESSVAKLVKIRSKHGVRALATAQGLEMQLRGLLAQTIVAYPHEIAIITAKLSKEQETCLQTLRQALEDTPPLATKNRNIRRL